tara:strand:- start:98 stop:466 length:369 start_codon:yes stop_codon:yes gene_type:complete
MVSVSVVTVPDGVEIRHQGKLVGTTPTMVSLEKSEQDAQLLLTKSGFEAKVVEFKPTKNQLIKESLVSNAPEPTKAKKSKTRSQRKRGNRSATSKSKKTAKPATKAAPKPKKKASRLDDYLD